MNAASSFLVFGSVVLASSPSDAMANDINNSLFRPNPLTNSFLEQVRIWEQAEADQLKYNGELERGDAGNKGNVEAYPRLLVPILIIAQELQQIQDEIQLTNSDNNKSYALANTILAQPKYESIAFKKTFNRFADNIYYSDPDRANLYLGGGATPKTEQSLAYLLRNEILTSVEDLKAELAYYAQHPNDTESQQDMLTLITTANTAMKKYIEIVPPRELERAQELLLRQQ